MKKLDYFIIGIGVTILIILGIIIYSNTKVNKDNIEIEILYQSESLYKLTLEDSGTYKIECKDNTLILYKNDIEIVSKNVETKDFQNTFKIENKKITMIDASCSGKDCTKMYISETHLIPIICTNGIVINPTNKTDVDVIV